MNTDFEKLQKLIKEHRLHNYEVASLVGISPTMLSFVFNGKRPLSKKLQKKLDAVIIQLESIPPKTVFSELRSRI